MRELTIALRATLVTLVLTGILYPLAVTGLGQTVMPAAANGSLLRDDRGQVVGSSLIGQPFTQPGYFWGRPSASGYDPMSSGGSNWGPSSAKLRQRILVERDRLAAEHPGAGPVPDELVTASASGLDPHISPATARWQAARVARARGVDLARVDTVLSGTIEGRELGFLGEPRVNVLVLNLALDRAFGRPLPPPPPITPADTPPAR
ncbi:MAG: potassium-transporting ATPase subunit KdpC [Deltaproteobacteria bacterium]|nr:potassium-transporting ATPase subunit KdpC [Deltaproteobacteria bacterium]